MCHLSLPIPCHPSYRSLSAPTLHLLRNNFIYLFVCWFGTVFLLDCELLTQSAQPVRGAKIPLRSNLSPRTGVLKKQNFRNHPKTSSVNSSWNISFLPVCHTQQFSLLSSLPRTKGLSQKVSFERQKDYLRFWYQ